MSEIEKLDTYTAWVNGELVGFFSVKYHFEQSIDLYVLGIKRDFHGRGIGSQLYKLIETDMKNKKVTYIQVNTLSPKAKNKDYLLTLKFYLKIGFVPLEEFPDLWGEDGYTPCLQLIKHI